MRKTKKILQLKKRILVLRTALSHYAGGHLVADKGDLARTALALDDKLGAAP